MNGFECAFVWSKFKKSEAAFLREATPSSQCSNRFLQQKSWSRLRVGIIRLIYIISAAFQKHKWLCVIRSLGKTQRFCWNHACRQSLQHSMLAKKSRSLRNESYFLACIGCITWEEHFLIKCRINCHLNDYWSHWQEHMYARDYKEAAVGTFCIYNQTLFVTY